MFESLTNRLGDTMSRIAARRLTEESIESAIRDVRIALLDADVALPLVIKLVSAVREKALQRTASRTATPGDVFVKLVHEELVSVLGSETAQLNVTGGTPPAVVLLAGLQGSGKTTTATKIGLFLRNRLQKKVSVVSVDVYRPAAIEQLRVLASEVGVRFIESAADDDPLSTAGRAVNSARNEGDDVLIVDTAGRLALDAEMMDEISNLQSQLQPRETLFVVDALSGQDVMRTAAEFGERLDLTGVVVTKLDGDSRGGSALSARMVTGVPIKFMGVGEKVDALELFHPERIASRILGMGDVVSLVEDAERKVDRDKATRIAKKVVGGGRFNFHDMRDQLSQVAEMGGMSHLLKMLPSAAQSGLRTKDVDDGSFKKMMVIIDSMTLQEREFPNLLNPSRKKRIAKGSGTDIRDVNHLLRQFRQMQKTTRKLGRGSRKNRDMQRMADLIDDSMKLE